MIVGLTGTRRGLTWRQEITLRAELESLEPNTQHVFLHGGCIGVDEQAHRMAAALGWRIEIHPSDVRGQRAYWLDAPFVFQPRPPLERDRTIVDRSEFLFACPYGPEGLRSGTWATIRYAREQGKPGRIVWPDGSTSPL